MVMVVKMARGVASPAVLRLLPVTEMTDSGCWHGGKSTSNARSGTLCRRTARVFLPSSGEGIPGWASQPNASTRATFPEPLGSPFTNDPATGFPTRQDCAKHGWGD